MNRERIEYFSHLTVCLAGALAVGFLFLRFLFVPLLPFLIAWCSALALRPLSVFISSRTHLPRRFVSALLTVFAVCIGLGGAVWLAVYGVGSAWEALSSLATEDKAFDILSKLTNPIGSLFGESEAATALEHELGEAIRSALSSLLTKVFDALTGVVSAVPKVLFFILVTVIAAIYFAADLDNINSRVKSLLPSRLATRLRSFKEKFFCAGIKYLRSYLIIMLITAAELLVGFSLIGVKKSLLLAIFVSLLDLLPVIGVGTVLVPWSVFELFFGNTARGVGLGVLFAVNLILRQVIEPKILGKSLGIHPILSLVLLYLGYSVFGILGLFLVPLFAVILNISIDKNNSSEVG